MQISIGRQHGICLCLLFVHALDSESQTIPIEHIPTCPFTEFNPIFARPFIQRVSFIAVIYSDVFERY